MPTKVGMRVYMMTVCRQRTYMSVPFDADGMVVTLPDFAKTFVEQHRGAREATPEEAERDRRWSFQPHNSDLGSHRGVVRYGISGFESDLVDSKTNKHEFRRQTTHVEIVPLFYEFWFPPGCNHAFAVFQSFAARSCVELVSAKMRTDFAERNPGFLLRFTKQMLTGEGGIYDTAPVKGLRLIKRKASTDVAMTYLNTNVSGDAVNFQVSISAMRNGFLGKLSDLASSIKAAKGGVIEHDGVIFDEAVAEIEFGGRRRRVGLLGSNSEAGVIDISDIKRGSDGHPLFSAISKESKELLADFQAVTGTKRKLP